MKKPTNRFEKGQVMVILTVGIVALLGFAALAIDGGMFYADRRYDQNAADNAALAGARAAGNVLYNQNLDIANFDCSNASVLAAVTAAYSAVENSAAEYNITGDHDISDGHGVYVECSDEAGTDGKYLLVKVNLTSETNTSFMQLVFNGNLQNTTDAVTRVEPGVYDPAGPSANGDGIVGLADNCDSEAIDMAADLSGNVNIVVKSGGIHSNSALGKDGASGYILTATGSEYRCVGGAPKKTEPFNVGPDQAHAVQTNPTHTDSLVTLHINPPDCAALDVKTASYNMTPGRYTNISLTSNNAVLTMAPGLYCWDGTVKITGGTVNVTGDNMDGVTIYFAGNSFEFEGNGQINLRAPRQGATGSGLAIPGLLFYTPESYTGDIKITGTADSILRGTFFVPSGTLNIGGDSGTSGWNAQWISKYVRFHGNPNFILNYTNDDLYWEDGHVSPSLLDVFQ